MAALSYTLADMQDPANPFYLHPDETPSLVLVSVPLSESNYHSWERGMKMSLLAKNKLSFIDGTIQEPNLSHFLHPFWARCNTMVLAWVIGSLSPNIARSVLRIDNAKTLWDELKERFGGLITSNTMEHDVFLSFRGRDTREDFIGFLYRALWARGIKTFIDEYGIERGKEVGPALLEAIEKSRMAVVVFSPGYATSAWCLDELVHIVTCMKTKGQLVHPVFRGIEPSQAQNLDDGCYREAFAQYEEKFETNPMKVKRWELAVHEATRLPGSHFKNGSEADFIQGVVEEIFQKLNSESSHHLSGQPELQRLLSTGSHRQVVGRTLFVERESKKNEVLEAPTKLLGTSSSQKESGAQQNEGFKTVLPFAASSSKYKGKVQQHEEPGMKEIESIENEAQARATAQRKQICTDIRFAKLVESSANQGSKSELSSTNTSK